MAVHDFGPVIVEVTPRDFNVVVYRAMGVTVACKRKSRRRWWCLWLCTTRDPVRVRSLRVTCSVNSYTLGWVSQSDKCSECTGINVEAVSQRGFFVPRLAGSFTYSGAVEVDGQVFHFEDSGIYGTGQAPPP